MEDACVEGVIVAQDGWAKTVQRRCHAQLVVEQMEGAKAVSAFVNRDGPGLIVLNKFNASLLTAAAMATAYWANASAGKAGRALIAIVLYRARTTAMTMEIVSMESVFVTSTTSVLTAAKVAV